SAYLMNLSKVYRYTLSHLDHSTVSLREELEFLRQYLALLQQRFGDGIKVCIAPEVSGLQGSLPPAALQMLIENAIKHNEHTLARPLTISVSCTERGIVVCNRKQPIALADEPSRSLSANVGLHNIVERYRLLTRKKVEIIDTPEEYRVTIPLIKTEK
ncbi:MAG: histidine kinase, partial [Bacteroidaceae bacterium]|nr:histidine kinase [Bacteroidaceae bacterium]